MYLKRLLSTKVRSAINYVRHNSTAYISNNKENLVITNKNRIEHFPLVWLRDNCTCEMCFHQNSNSRIINWNNFDISPKVKSVEVFKASVTIKWQDDHISEFNNDWLYERSFLKSSQNNYLEKNYRPKKVLWNKSSIRTLVKTFEFNDVLNKNLSLLNWLKDLAIHGVAFLENVPKNNSQCRQLANRIAFIRKTHYQDEFDIISKPDTSNVAYLSDFLQLHTDLPYYEYTPGVTLLYCLAQTDSTGGESLLADGFYVAEKLRVEDLDSFNILSSVEVNWCDVGAEHGDKYHSIFRSPVIRLNSCGKLEKILHSIPQRDSHFNIDLNLVKPWYKAMKIFVNAINEEAYKFKLKPGTMMAFDNTRLLHGRMGYKDVINNQRHLIGCYIDWDEIFSKMRVLVKEQEGSK